MIYPIARDLPGTLSTMPAPLGGAGLDDALAELRAQGVDMVVSLLPPGQAAALELDGEAAAAARAGLGFRSLPIDDFGVPDRDAFAAPLRALGAALDDGQHLAIHCWAGIGRSSLVAAALLVLRGDDPATAWDRVAAGRGVPVPETEAQRRWVYGLTP
ncbi:MAG TPA: hypothetical protein VGP36_16520 [Mycobacteriales bacterium]|nr:hypothetical protein [Mycobacteriales bacterium]